MQLAQTLLHQDVFVVVATSTTTSGHDLLVDNFHRRLLVQQARQKCPYVGVVLVDGVVEPYMPSFTIVVRPDILVAGLTFHSAVGTAVNHC